MQNYKWNVPIMFQPEEKLPEDDVRVIVVCPGFRCLGYLHQGIWRQVYGDEEMNDVVGWAG
jgi:hypothetical protein